VDRVEFLINGIIAGTDYLAPYAIAWNSITHGDGPVAIRARVVDTSTNVTFSASRTIIVDNAAPDTTIDSGPAGSANGSAAAFTFSANEPDATFDCALDAGDLVDCTSSQSYSNLAAGAHTFQVVATDAAGNTDPTPARRIWTVRSDKSIVWLPTLRR
jgi:large repetitive protein